MQGRSVYDCCSCPLLSFFADLELITLSSFWGPSTPSWHKIFISSQKTKYQPIPDLLRESIKLLGKVVILSVSDLNLGLDGMSYTLPEVQLSVFVKLIQILFEYMHPIVSGKCLSKKMLKMVI
jgi:hypothetical protein